MEEPVGCGLPFGRRLVGWVLLGAVSITVAHFLGRATSSPSVREDRPDVPEGEQANTEKKVGVPWAASLVPAAPVPSAEAEEEEPGNEPEEWRSGGDYTLRVQKRQILLPGAAGHGDPQEVEMLTYNGRLIGPTIRVERGTTLKITLINELPAEGTPPVTVDPKQEDPPHDLYTTNLHTHGLHVSPRGQSDNVFRKVPPGDSYQYVFTIPPDHPAGTFWYHPHTHGSVAYQMANGMAGALIVEGKERTTAVPDLDDIPEIAQVQEHILVLQQLSLRPDGQGVCRVDPNDIYNEPDPEAYQVMAVNGAVLPTYTMNPKEVQRWRFIHAGRLGSVLLCWYNDKGMRNNRMHWHEIAVDGLATGKITARRSITLRPGNRSDVLFKAPDARGTYFLTALEEDESSGSEILTESYVARLVVRGPEREMTFPVPAQLVACRPFKSIAPGECKGKRDLVFDYDDKSKFFHINGSSFSNQTSVDQVMLGTAEEWTLTAANQSESANEPHPFHMHVNPFQVVQIENLATKVVTKVDEWRDSAVVEKGKKLTIRMRFRDFPGKTVLHCHTLDHEDQGMMRTIQITDPARPDRGDEPVAKLLDCARPAPRLSLRTTQGTAWDLRSVGQRDVILVFFRGMACSHCQQELRKLVRESSDLVGTDTTLVAVSSRPIANPVDAVESLNVPEGLDFHLLEDEGDRGFRSFGCYDEGPLHGLFVIDKAGMIRGSYVGEAPFGDPRTVVTLVRQLGEPAWQDAP